MKEKKIMGVAIVTYNREKLLQECLECVFCQSRLFDKVVVINNCSTDGTKDYLDNLKKNSRYENMTVIHTTKNLGGAGGFCLAVKEIYAKVDYLLLIDDDAMLDKLFLENIEKNMEDNILAYSGTVLTGGKIDTSHRRNLKNRTLMIKQDVELERYKENSFLYELSTFCGLMISGELIKEIGFPKSEYFIWYDDTEYSLRIRKYTYIKNVNTATINHKAISSISTNLNWKSYYGYRNSINMGKTYSRIPAVFTVYRYTYHLLRWIQYSVKSKIYKEKKEYYRASARLNLDVIIDSIKNKLGVSEKYYPGFKF